MKNPWRFGTSKPQGGVQFACVLILVEFPEHQEKLCKERK
ncbi:hypothetical protein HAL09_04460 [Helicobacter ailurogastricus]|uniref:Uncharacterized protein n=1 Tax=Helicobacter ailurogastricus TaxID=1578720 RepID=A0A0K2X571_9HELI|nr:hypothetical protein HAL011_13850 [Helicobacter ailurogastricus]CRF43888.1 hypothetical protein HAL09_04460 [Helicobacter ailurogastricus]